MKNWKSLLSYAPIISLLAKGYIIVIFLEDTHATTVLNSPWCIGEGSMVLDHWHVNFDPLKERVKKGHLWVLLPALPFPLWSHTMLEGIGNTIGRFVVLQEDFMNSYDKGWPRLWWRWTYLSVFW